MLPPHFFSLPITLAASSASRRSRTVFSSFLGTRIVREYLGLLVESVSDGIWGVARWT